MNGNLIMKPGLKKQKQENDFPQVNLTPTET
jgi:hypothetical protein